MYIPQMAGSGQKICRLLFLFRAYGTDIPLQSLSLLVRGVGLCYRYGLLGSVRNQLRVLSYSYVYVYNPVRVSNGSQFDREVR